MSRPDSAKIVGDYCKYRAHTHRIHSNGAQLGFFARKREPPVLDAGVHYIDRGRSYTAEDGEYLRDQVGVEVEFGEIGFVMVSLNHGMPGSYSLALNISIPKMSMSFSSGASSGTYWAA